MGHMLENTRSNFNNSTTVFTLGVSISLKGFGGPRAGSVDWLRAPSRGPEIAVVYTGFAFSITCKVEQMKTVKARRGPDRPSGPKVVTALYFSPLTLVGDAKNDESLRRATRFRCIVESQKP